MGLAGLGLTRLVLAALGSLAATFIGVVALVDRRNVFCQRIAVVPSVSCPPMFERATEAATFALTAGVVVAVVCAVLARTRRRPWLRAVVADGRPYSVPATWGLLTFLSWFSLLLGGLFYAIFSAVVLGVDGAEPTPSTGAYQVVLTGVLLALAALAWTSWRLRRTHSGANRRAGFPVFTVARTPPGAGGSYRSAPGDGGSGYPPTGGVHGAFSEQDGPQPWGAPEPEPTGYPRDGSPYGDGPQHGTRSLADEQGGFYDDDHRDLRPPAEQPGNPYSSDPFGREPD